MPPSVRTWATTLNKESFATSRSFFHESWTKEPLVLGLSLLDGLAVPPSVSESTSVLKHLVPKTIHSCCKGAAFKSSTCDSTKSSQASLTLFGFANTTIQLFCGDTPDLEASLRPFGGPRTGVQATQDNHVVLHSVGWLNPQWLTQTLRNTTKAPTNTCWIYWQLKLSLAHLSAFLEMIISLTHILANAHKVRLRNVRLLPHQHTIQFNTRAHPSQAKLCKSVPPIFLPSNTQITSFLPTNMQITSFLPTNAASVFFFFFFLA